MRSCSPGSQRAVAACMTTFETATAGRLHPWHSRVSRSCCSGWAIAARAARLPAESARPAGWPGDLRGSPAAGFKVGIFSDESIPEIARLVNGFGGGGCLSLHPQGFSLEVRRMGCQSLFARLLDLFVGLARSDYGARFLHEQFSQSLSSYRHFANIAPNATPAATAHQKRPRHFDTSPWLVSPNDSAAR